MHSIKFWMLKVHENVISLRKWSGSTAQLHSLEWTLPHGISERRGPEMITSFSSPGIHSCLYLYIFFSVQGVTILLNLSSAIKPNGFNWLILHLDCCELKIKVFYSSLQHHGTTKQWGQTADISRYYLVVLLWMALKILLDHIDLFYKLHYFLQTWCFAPDLEFLFLFLFFHWKICVFQDLIS